MIQRRAGARGHYVRRIRSSPVFEFFFFARGVARKHIREVSQRRAFVRDLLRSIAGTARRAPAIIARKRAAGVDLVPNSLEAHFAPYLEQKRRLTRAKEGAGAVARAFQALSPEEQAAAAAALFRSAGIQVRARRDPAKALEALFAALREQLQEGIDATSKAIPTSNDALLRESRLASFVAVFTHHNVPVAHGNASPFVGLCSKAGLRRGFVRDHLAEMQANVRDYLDALYRQ